MRAHFFSSAYVETTAGLVLDFGVMSGDSTLLLAEALEGDLRNVWGFDAFEGIRDPWSKTDRPPGSMSLQGIAPHWLVDHPKVELVVGWVEDTLSEFLRLNPGPVGMIHLDLDVYGPTHFVLSTVKPLLQRGGVLIFDDFFGFVGWQNHSARAFFEVFHDSEWSCLAISPQQAVFKLL